MRCISLCDDHVFKPNRLTRRLQLYDSPCNLLIVKNNLTSQFLSCVYTRVNKCTSFIFYLFFIFFLGEGERCTEGFPYKREWIQFSAKRRRFNPFKHHLCTVSYKLGCHNETISRECKDLTSSVASLNSRGLKSNMVVCTVYNDYLKVLLHIQNRSFPCFLDLKAKAASKRVGIKF